MTCHSGKKVTNSTKKVTYENASFDVGNPIRTVVGVFITLMRDLVEAVFRMQTVR